MQTDKINVAIFGASNNPDRYSYKAAKMLAEHGYSIRLIGLKKAEIFNLQIEPFETKLIDTHTITLYISPDNQKPYYDYILQTNPKRIIFNPGTENYALMQLAQQQNILCEIACTLVLLSTNQFI